MYFNLVDPRDLRAFPLAEPFEKALLAVCAVDREMTVGTLAAFVSIARRIPALAVRATTLGELADEMGVGYSSLLRQTDCLAAGSVRVRSLGLVEKAIKPEDRRSREIFLTPKGEALMKTITACMQAPLTLARTAPVKPKLADTKQEGPPATKAENGPDSGNSGI